MRSRVIAVVVLAAAAACAAGCAGDGGELSAREMVTAVSEEAWPWGSLSGSETQTELRLMLVAKRGGYTARSRDRRRLLRALRDETLDVPCRLCAASYLLDLGEDEAKTFVARLAGSRDEEVLRNVIHVLARRAGRDGETWAAERMVAMLKAARLDTSGQMWTGDRDALARALQDERKLREISGALKLRTASRYPRWPRYVHELCWALAALEYAPAVPALADALRRTPDDSWVLKALVDIDARAAEPMLLETLVEEPVYDAFDALWIAERLKAIPPPQRAERLPEVLDDFDEFAAPRKPALRASQLSDLVAIKSKESVPVLLEHLHCEGAASALAAIEGARAVVPLIEFARASDDRIAVAEAVAAVGKVGGPEAVGGLVGLLDRPPPKSGQPPEGPAGQHAWPRGVFEALRGATQESSGGDAGGGRAWLARPEAGKAEAASGAKGE
jgi:hypothetical protein